VPRPIARARAVAMSQMVVHQMAIRARAVDEGGNIALDDDTFLDNVRRMATGMLVPPVAEDTAPPAAL
jgi:hypothetical protein